MESYVYGIINILNIEVFESMGRVWVSTSSRKASQNDSAPPALTLITDLNL